MTTLMARRLHSLVSPSRRYDGVRPINIYLLRVLFGLMAVFLGADAWTHIATFSGVWEPAAAAAWCMWAAFALLAVVGVVNPVKMLPLVMLEIVYKVLWLAVVAYPLWSKNELAGSPAEEMAYGFSWVVLAIIAMPWRYVFTTYITGARRHYQRRGSRQLRANCPHEPFDRSGLIAGNSAANLQWLTTDLLTLSLRRPWQEAPASTATQFGKVLGSKTSARHTALFASAGDGPGRVRE